MNPKTHLATRLAALSAALLTILLVSACGDDDGEEGLRAASTSGGPTINFDMSARPLPDIPFPNDLLTRPDRMSPTGVRVALPGPSEGYQEAEVRAALEEMSGFGVFSPITISFDQPLDLEILIARHQQMTPDFSDDAVYLVNIDPNSPNYGNFELIDMGLGNFPVTQARPDGYYTYDRFSDGTNLLFPTEAHHGPVPNLRDPDADPLEFGQLLDFYERSTNTLILRPVHPLETNTRYAVVLTSAVRGEDARPVDSPFDTINDPAQTETLKPLREILPNACPQRFGPRLANLRFAWSFTTGDPTRHLRDIRAGLYGVGPLAELAEAFPAQLNAIHNVRGTDPEDGQFTFDLDAILALVLPLAADEVGSGGVDLLESSYDFVDYLVSGSFYSPNLLGPYDGLADHGDDAVVIDTPQGPMTFTATEVPFICMVPTERPTTGGPSPVIIYSHAIGSTRIESLGFAGSMAKFGFATCTIDAAGHGVDIPSEFNALLDQVAENQGLPHLPKMLRFHRARDLTNNGNADSGGDYFTSDMLKSRANIGQTTIDQMQFVRILRAFDGQRRLVDDDALAAGPEQDWFASWDQSGDGQAEIAGDFTGDGHVDFGGDRPYVTWGTSLGGIQSSILAAAEPAIVAGASNAGGGGLADVAIRTTIGNVRAGVVLRMMGPVLIGTPSQDGQSTFLEWMLPRTSGIRYVHFATIDALEDGDQIMVRNLAREQFDTIAADKTRGETVVDSGIFRVGVAAQAINVGERRVAMGFDSSLSLWAEIMQCRAVSQCGGNSCDEGHFCSLDETCRPLNECYIHFDPDLLDDERRDEFDLRVAHDPTEFGDPLVVEIYDSDGNLKHEIDTFPHDVVDENIFYPAGAPLAALADGWGLTRQTPAMRQYVGIAQMLIETVDPAVWAPHYSLRPLDFPYETDDFREGYTNFLTIGTLGDQVVPISSSIAIARAAGALETETPNFYYGMPENQYLIENFVYEGISHFNRFPRYSNTLFDPDVLDAGKWHEPKPNAAPAVRATRVSPRGVNALRLGYLDRTGEHTFNVPDPSRPFDGHAFLTNQVGWFLASGGQVISDDPCLEDFLMASCGFFDPQTFRNPL